MKIKNLIWDPENTPEALHDALNNLAEEYPLQTSGRGTRLMFRELADDGENTSRVSVKFGRGTAEIASNTLPGMLRGLSSVMAGIEGEEKAPFRTLGIMLDCSRGKVLTVEYLESWLRRLALAGYNQLQLYCEDTYELPGEPMFGFMRGGYSLEELQYLDGFAAELGIELVGCIQTLGHMTQALSWSAYSKVADQPEILLIDEPETYQLIEKMIRFWSEALRSRRIHIGMDEAHGFGRGKYLDRHGKSPDFFALFNKHLGRVKAICDKYGEKPMIWSDMYFRMASPTGMYYDTAHPVPPEVCREIPAGVELVYWDYYHEDQAVYDYFIDEHRRIGGDVLLTSGIWTWKKFWYDHEFTRRTVVPCIAACREKKVNELVFAMWGDDGAYCSAGSSLAGILFAADLAYGTAPEDEVRTGWRFAAVCSADYAAHLAAGGLDVYPAPDAHEGNVIHASSMLWDDILYGISWRVCMQWGADFDRMVEKRYREILKRIRPAADEYPAAGDLRLAVRVAEAVIAKNRARRALVTAYRNRDRAGLHHAADVLLPEAAHALELLNTAIRNDWLAAAKPFGMEIPMNRTAAAIARILEAVSRVNDYLDGALEEIAELEVAENVIEQPWCRTRRTMTSNITC